MARGGNPRMFLWLFLLVLYPITNCVAGDIEGIYINFPPDDSIYYVKGLIYGAEFKSEKQCNSAKGVKYSYISKLIFSSITKDGVKSSNNSFQFDKEENRFITDFDKKTGTCLWIFFHLEGDLKRYYQRNLCDKNQLELSVERNRAVLGDPIKIKKENFTLICHDTDKEYKPYLMEINESTSKMARIDLYFKDQEDERPEYPSPSISMRVPSEERSINERKEQKKETPRSLEKRKEMPFSQPVENYQGFVVSFLNQGGVILAQKLWENVDHPLQWNDVQDNELTITRAVVHFPEGDLTTELNGKTRIVKQDFIEKFDLKCDENSDFYLLYKKDNTFFLYNTYECPDKRTISLDRPKGLTYWTIRGPAASVQPDEFLYRSDFLDHKYQNIRIETAPRAEVIIFGENGLARKKADDGGNVVFSSFWRSGSDLKAYVFEPGFSTFLNDKNHGPRSLNIKSDNSVDIELEKLEVKIKPYKFNLTHESRDYVEPEEALITILDKKSKIILKSKLKNILHVPPKGKFYQFVETDQFRFPVERIDDHFPFRAIPKDRNLKISFDFTSPVTSFKLKEEKGSDVGWKNHISGDTVSLWIPMTDLGANYNLCVDGHQMVSLNINRNSSNILKIDLKKNIPQKLILIPGIGGIFQNLNDAIYMFFEQSRYNFHDQKNPQVLMIQNSKLILVESLRQLGYDLGVGGPGDFTASLNEYFSESNQNIKTDDCVGHSNEIYYITAGYPDKDIRDAAEKYPDIKFLVLMVNLDNPRNSVKSLPLNHESMDNVEWRLVDLNVLGEELYQIVNINIYD